MNVLVLFRSALKHLHVDESVHAVILDTGKAKWTSRPRDKQNEPVSCECVSKSRSYPIMGEHLRNQQALIVF